MLDTHEERRDVCCHLAIACGGTGGHFYPTLAVARKFSEMGHGVTLLVAGKHAGEQAAIATKYGFASREVPAVRLEAGLAAKLSFPFQFLGCVRAARRILGEVRPDILLGMGSFAAVPSCLALPRRTPLVLHEGNALMGKANRFFMRKARAVCLSLPLADGRQLRGARAVTVGMPLREALVELAMGKTAVPADYLQQLGLRSGRQTVLVFGGSQGARFINDLIRQSLALLPDVAERIQFIHLTGSDDNAGLIDAYAAAGIAASIRRSESAIENCYAMADLVICRAGASSICELALFGKPAILIPLPTAADDHQTVNAQSMAAAGAARLLAQRDASPTLLSDWLRKWLDDSTPWLAMGEAIRSFARPDAATAMAELLAELWQESKAQSVSG
ncbi:MAG: UDP-N-acetylglucosamine--N-acetylmuramyl-(pentapeptide) pyrophosphoryl-undecaprenol N-acetylglucosamine transferase [Lentisphaeria bacterium]|jgi:UDP-N-acetylglucosamine--N-acetylmuramyl-(pentapeptide) pyrophosphoryl-undecaprenol N-acetylglucosamine transferase